jgi:uncharacterized membrane protein
MMLASNLTRHAQNPARALSLLLGPESLPFCCTPSACGLSAQRRPTPILSSATRRRAGSGVSIGYKDAEGWATEGWWNIASHTCETLLKGVLIGRYYYIHAVDYDRGGEWAGSLFMCTDDKSFTIRDTKDCVKRGYKKTGFFEVDTGEERDWTVRLTDPEGEAKSQ